MRVLFSCAFFSPSLLRVPGHSNSVLQIVTASKVSNSFQKRPARRPGHKADHLPPSTAEVKTKWNCNSAPPVCVHGLLMDSCTLYRLQPWNAESRCKGSRGFVRAPVTLSLTTWKKGKFAHVHAMKAYEKWRYSSAFATSALDGGDWSASRLAALSLEEEPQYQLNRRLGGPQSLSRRFWEEKNLFKFLYLLILIPVFILKRIGSWCSDT
jgi:hypothetical protein